jgi:hypothetical protein
LMFDFGGRTQIGQWLELARRKGIYWIELESPKDARLGRLTILVHESSIFDTYAFLWNVSNIITQLREY